MEIHTPLLGTWELKSWYNELADGRRVYPIGEDVTGYISYATDGFVFVHVMAKTRSLFAVSDPLGGTPEEDAAAMKSHMTYAGRYTDHGEYVVHDVTTASCPNWVGTQQRREIQIDGDKLQLSAEAAVFKGQVVRACLNWERPSL